MHRSVDQGEIESGLELFEQVLSRAPESAISHFLVTREKRFWPGDAKSESVVQLKRLLCDEQRSEIARIHLHFALAKVLDDIGGYEVAWEHHDRAKRLKPSRSPTISSRVRRRVEGERPLRSRVDAATQLLTQTYYREYAIDSVEDVTPIFIVGMPRSGTTLTEQILSSHPDIAGAGQQKWIDRRQWDYPWERDSSIRGSDNLADRKSVENRLANDGKPSMPTEIAAGRQGSLEFLLP